MCKNSIIKIVLVLNFKPITMKNLQPSIGVLLLIALAFVNCTKDEPEPTPPSFNYSTFTDVRDGKTYKYIKIGTQDWMAENLAYKTGSGSWNPENIEANGVRFGRLYTWEAAKQAVPDGWHLPSDSEWKTMEMMLGMSQNVADGIDSRGTDEGYKLKATEGWSNYEKESGNGIDLVGFSALPGGMRSNSGDFFTMGFFGYWWTADAIDVSRAWMRCIKYHKGSIYRNTSFKEDAYSVRCIKD
jgi:uncharacterized protein (TIGR02145 family)